MRKYWKQIIYSAEHSSWQCEGEPALNLKGLVATTNQHWSGPLKQNKVGNVNISLSYLKHLSALKTKQNKTWSHSHTGHCHGVIGLCIPVCDLKFFASLTASQYLRVKYPSESLETEAKKMWSWWGWLPSRDGGLWMWSVYLGGMWCCKEAAAKSNESGHSF